MKTLKLHVTGTTPLLMHNPAGGMSQPSTKLGIKPKFDPEDDARASCYMDEGGGFYLPSPAFRSAVLEAAKGRKFGKTFATTIVKGSVFAATEQTSLLDPDTGEVLRNYEVDTRRVMVQRNGVLRSRAKLPRWAGVVEFEYDEEFISPEHIVELLSIAGRTVGVGDFRPQKSGPFGRFVVAESK
jgi:hypothetical protein